MLTQDDKEYIRLVVRDEVQSLYKNLTSNGIMPTVREVARDAARDATKLSWQRVVVLLLAGAVVGGGSPELFRLLIGALVSSH